MTPPRSKQSQRIGNAFHETFSLSRAAIAKIMEISESLSGHVDLEAIRDGSTLGNNYVKAMPRYAVGCGFLVDRTNQITSLGAIVRQKDPHLSLRETHWLMHYHLSAPKGPGPEFWAGLTQEFLVPGREFSGDELVAHLSARVFGRDGAVLAERTLRGMASVFVGTYEKDEGLGRLNLIERSGSTYRVMEPEPPATGVVAYCLAHHWCAIWDNMGGAKLDDLYGHGGVASRFFLTRYALNKRLRELQTSGFLELYQLAPPHTLERRWASSDDFLDMIYG